ncbi:putative BEL1-like homeodomain protein 3 [Melia azedarach]|uniref:BEL1-like homeodomain protein 3 n=1 Tax=Melia azedarach TaxID=155640 RepID=A0ACC1WS36_MELAZ|nr:putative BEL1-like homeodomain protein 3 [Melia azedarach]
MAAYNPSLSNQREGFPTLFPEIFRVGSSLSHQSCIEIPSTGGRNEKMFIPSTSDAGTFSSINGQLNTGTGNLIGNSVTGDSQVFPRTQPSTIDSEQNFQCQGLSLSLGTHMTSAVSVPSFQYQYSSPSFSSFLRTHLPIPAKGTMPCQDDESEKRKELRTSEGLLSSFETESLCNTQYSVGHKEMYSNAYQYEPINFINTLLKSKYLKSAQQLLDEVVNVQRALKQPNSDKEQNCNGNCLDDTKGTDGRSSSLSKLPATDGGLSNPTESFTKSSELSQAERQDLQNKKTKLLSLLEEVDRRYKQYYHQMQILMSSFDMVVGQGAAKSYTALALQTISRHFRTLRDAMSGQIQVTRRSLGEQETSSNGQVSIPRLRFVDHQLRQQRALQELGVMRHAWRPQRGLPESSVSILRAWLFEHFLHPYPSDSEKSMLARETGLTRNQVANWFINARVRLWKPMVEEMYKEEFGNPEENSKSWPENVQKACSENSSAPENRGEELQDSLTSKAGKQVHELKFDHIPDVEMTKSVASSAFHEGGHGDNVFNSGIMRLQDERPSINDHRLYNIIPQNQNGNVVLMGATGPYGMSELCGFDVSNQVTLALGLRHHESDVFPIPAGNNIGGGDNTVASPVEHDAVDYHCMDMGNQQDKFGNPNLLHDFVA